MHSQSICKKYINQQYIELFASFSIVLRRSFMKLYHYYIKLMMFDLVYYFILISFQALQWSYKARIKFLWNLQSYEVIFFRVFFLSLKSLMGYGRLAYFSVEGMLLPFRVSVSHQFFGSSTWSWSVTTPRNIDFRYFFPCNRQLTRLQGGVASESHLLTFHDVAFCQVFCNNVIDM